MAETLGHFFRRPLEEIRLSLHEVRGEPQVELRVYVRATPADAHSLSGMEGIVLPAKALPELVRVLTQAQETLLRRGMIWVQPAPAPTHMERGERTFQPPGARPAQDARRYPRVPLNVPVVCRLLDPPSFWSAKPVSGEVKDVSLGGAQAWLPKCFPRYHQLDVSMVIDGTPFHGSAEIVGTDLMKAKKDEDYCCHRLQWVGMDGQAKAALLRVLPPEHAPGEPR